VIDRLLDEQSRKLQPNTNQIGMASKKWACSAIGWDNPKLIFFPTLFFSASAFEAKFSLMASTKL